MRDFRHQLRHRHLDVEREHSFPRSHHLGCAPRTEIEHAMDHRALCRFDLSLVFAEPEQRLELRLGNRAGRRRLLERREMPRERMNKLRQHRQRPRCQPC
ncbi:MAG: hypothetical protein ABSD30_16535 [Candidatus Binatus sp.]